LPPWQVVNGLKKHPQADVGDAAVRIVNKWKALVDSRPTDSHPPPPTGLDDVPLAKRKRDDPSDGPPLSASQPGSTSSPKLRIIGPKDPANQGTIIIQVRVIMIIIIIIIIIIVSIIMIIKIMMILIIIIMILMPIN
jgi:hypothetical protein